MCSSTVASPRAWAAATTSRWLSRWPRKRTGRAPGALVDGVDGASRRSGGRGGGRGVVAVGAQLGPDDLAVGGRADPPGVAEGGDHPEAPAGEGVGPVVA